MAEGTTPDFASKPRDGAVRWSDLLIAFFGGSFAGVVLSVLVGGAALLIAVAMGFRLNGGGFVGCIQNSFWVNQAAIVLSDLGLLATIWLVARWRTPHPVRHYFPPLAASTLALAALSGVALSLLLNGGNELLARASLVTFRDSAVERALVPHSAAQFAASLAVVALFAPLVEEFFFRGLFYAWLRRSRSVGVAVCVTALAFALGHGHFLLHPGAQGWLYTSELALAGVVLALWVARTGSLWASFATHAAYNAVAIAFSVLLP
ncbi:MAG TPA: CPBP family intramembrane glutamic endopeptidase [Rhizomicrobium sp.]